MAVRQAEQENRKKRWMHYLLISTSILLSVLLVFGIVYFWEEIQHAEGYGYLGGFLVSILGGIAIIPAPSLLVTFSLGGVLHPVYVGLLSGLGEALGGITVYLTGAGGGALWSKLQSKRHALYNRLGLSSDSSTEAKSKLHSKWQAFNDRLVGLVGKRGGYWAVFITSVMIISPFYFAALAAGTLRMGLKRFFLVSLAGKTIRGLIIAFAGYWGLHYLLQWMGG